MRVVTPEPESLGSDWRFGVLVRLAQHGPPDPG